MRKTVRQRERWKKPPEGKLLMNIGGSFRLSEGQGNGGTGVVIKDSNGSFIADHALIWNMWWMPQYRR
jgi:hypothetical protein